MTTSDKVEQLTQGCWIVSYGIPVRLPLNIRSRGCECGMYGRVVFFLFICLLVRLVGGFGVGVGSFSLLHWQSY